MFLHKNIYCGYSLEVAQRGTSNEYPQHMFLWRYKDNINTSWLNKAPVLQPHNLPRKVTLYQSHILNNCYNTCFRTIIKDKLERWSNNISGVWSILSNDKDGQISLFQQQNISCGYSLALPH